MSLHRSVYASGCIRERLQNLANSKKMSTLITIDVHLFTLNYKSNNLFLFF